MRPTSQVELSPRARRFLGTLERRPAVPTEEVEAILSAEGCPCFAPWLAFHERYAGYVEFFYHDGFVWGLVHRSSYWWKPNRANWEQDGPAWSIWCADGHPTYFYELDQDGVLAAHGGHRSFDLYVERVAAVREIARRGEARELSREEVCGPAFREVFSGRIEPWLVAELSDQFWHYYLSDRYLVLQRAEDGGLFRAWERLRGGGPGADPGQQAPE